MSYHMGDVAQMARDASGRRGGSTVAQIVQDVSGRRWDRMASVFGPVQAHIGQAIVALDSGTRGRPMTPADGETARVVRRSLLDARMSILARQARQARPTAVATPAGPGSSAATSGLGLLGAGEISPHGPVFGDQPRELRVAGGALERFA